jgi:hypothetical protein
MEEPMMAQSVPATRLAPIMDAMIAAYNAKRFDELREILAPKFYFRHHNRNFELRDRDSFIATLRQFASEFVPDRKFGPPLRTVEAGNVVVREHQWGGNVRNVRVDIPGMARAGEFLELDLCTVCIFNGDRIAEYHDYG